MNKRQSHTQQRDHLNFQKRSISDVTTKNVNTGDINLSLAEKRLRQIEGTVLVQDNINQEQEQVVNQGQSQQQEQQQSQQQKPQLAELKSRPILKTIQQCQQGELFFTGCYPTKQDVAKYLRVSSQFVQMKILKHQLVKQSQSKYPGYKFNWGFNRSYAPGKRPSRNSTINYRCGFGSYRCKALLKYQYDEQDKCFYLYKCQNAHNHFKFSLRKIRTQRLMEFERRHILEEQQLIKKIKNDRNSENSDSQSSIDKCKPKRSSRLMNLKLKKKNIKCQQTIQSIQIPKPQAHSKKSKL